MAHVHATRPSIRILRDRRRFTDLSLFRYTPKTNFPDVGVKKDGEAGASGYDRNVHVLGADRQQGR